MSLTVISREEHSAKRWKRYSSYAFAAKDAVAMQHAQRLGQLAEQHAAAEQPLPADGGDLYLEFLHDDGNIRFS